MCGIKISERCRRTLFLGRAPSSQRASGLIGSCLTVAVADSGAGTGERWSVLGFEPVGDRQITRPRAEYSTGDSSVRDGNGARSVQSLSKGVSVLDFGISSGSDV